MCSDTSALTRQHRGLDTPVSPTAIKKAEAAFAAADNTNEPFAIRRANPERNKSALGKLGKLFDADDLAD